VLACSEDCRSPECLRQVVDQFHVEDDERYKRDSFGCKGTRCNVFATDVTAAMECLIPHWIDNNGQPVRHHSPGAHELSVNGMFGWLHVYGSDNGWQVVSQPEARSLANQGRPVVAIWENKGIHEDGTPKSGHIAVLLPTPEGMLEPRIAQAGAINFVDRPLSHGFASIKPEFWCHS
jgi:hypothetical protein